MANCQHARFLSVDRTDLFWQGTWLFMSARLLRRPDSSHSYEDDLESFLYVMAWVSFTYMESNVTPQTRFNLLKTMFEDEEGKDQHGNTLGGRYKDMTLRVGGFYHKDIFKEPRVDGLLNGLAKLFSCRYSILGDPRHEADAEKLRDLETFDKFSGTFQTLLGEESRWGPPAGPKAHPVDDGTWKPRAPKVQEQISTRPRNLRLIF